jgi:hypothetical protein
MIYAWIAQPFPGEDVLITGDMIHSPIPRPLRLPAGGKDAASGVRPILRRTYLDVRDALPLPLHRTRAPLG